MTWQEYQEAVARLYEQMDSIGVVKRNVHVPDKETGSSRQIDVLVELEAKGHKILMVVDAKFRKEKLNVKDVEEVHSLACAARASKAVIVALNGWNESAERKASALNLDLRILTLDEALDLFVEDKWELCEHCNQDCIILDQDGMVEYKGRLFWWFAGQCRHCKTGFVWCQDCGEKFYLQPDESRVCYCGHSWMVNAKRIELLLAK